MSHNGNINIGTSSVATNKVNIGSTSIPTYINGNVRVKNQYFMQASSNVIRGNTTIDIPCYSTYSVSNTIPIVITLPSVSVSDIGLKLSFVRVTDGYQVSFKPATGQTIYDGAFIAYNNTTEIALMPISKNSITLVYLNIDDTNYGWFQM